MRTLTLVIILTTGAVMALADDYERQPGIDVQHYEVSLELSDSSNVISGSTRVRLAARQGPLSGLWLDFDGMRVDRLLVDGVEVQYSHHEGRLRLVLERSRRPGEILEVDVKYHGEPQKRGLLITSDRYGKRVFFAENWPDNAHRWFPCIDHPSDKASVDFLITAPSHYEVVANGELEERHVLGSGRTLSHWHEGTAIPTYCMVIAVADYSVMHPVSTTGVPLGLYVYPGDVGSASVRFARTDRIVSFFKGLIGAFPFEKLAQAEATTRLGGMENASVIFYSEEGFKDEPGGEAPVPHEIAHQWFGDSVTEDDWDHLWLSEGFATYLDALFYEQADGHEAFLRIMRRAAETAIKYMRAHPEPVIDPGMKDISKKLNPLNYEKGAWILHMLRRKVGNEHFFAGLRRYYLTYAGKNALTTDFQRVMESESGMPLSGFFERWLFQSGWPQCKVRWSWNPRDDALSLEVRQTQETAPFDIPMDVKIQCGGGSNLRTVRLSEREEEIKIPIGCEPTGLSLDPDGWVLGTMDVRRQ